MKKKDIMVYFIVRQKYPFHLIQQFDTGEYKFEVKVPYITQMLMA